MSYLLQVWAFPQNNDFECFEKDTKASEILVHKKLSISTVQGITYLWGDLLTYINNISYLTCYLNARMSYLTWLRNMDSSMSLSHINGQHGCTSRKRSKELYGHIRFCFWMSYSRFHWGRYFCYHIMNLWLFYDRNFTWSFSALKQVLMIFLRCSLFRWFLLMLIKLWGQTWGNCMIWIWRAAHLHILHSAIIIKTWMVIDFGSKLVTYLQ